MRKRDDTRHTPRRRLHLKQQVFFALDDAQDGSLPARVCGYALLGVIVLNAITVFLDDTALVRGDMRFALAAFWIASDILFACEYLLRLWTADYIYPELPPVRARLRYMVSLFGIIDLLSFLPGIITLVTPLSEGQLGVFRVIRALRVLKMSRYMSGLHTIGRVATKRRGEILAAFLVLALLTLVASDLMYEAEHEAQPDKFDSVFSGLYWAVTTVTSTGYGDLSPITPLGRFIGICVMVLSVAAVAIPAGIFSAGFVEEFRNQDDRHSRAKERARREAEEGRHSAS